MKRSATFNRSFHHDMLWPKLSWNFSQSCEGRVVNHDGKIVVESAISAICVEEKALIVRSVSLIATITPRITIEDELKRFADLLINSLGSMMCAGVGMDLAMNCLHIEPYHRRLTRFTMELLNRRSDKSLNCGTVGLDVESHGWVGDGRSSGRSIALTTFVFPSPHFLL